MRQHTTLDQTAKLIELGFEKPKIAAPALKWVDREPTFERQYTIGELIEMLEEVASVVISYSYQKRGYYVRVIIPKRMGGGMYRISQTELVDALYDMIIKLKDEVKTKAQDALKCNLCEVALAQSKPEKHKDDAWHTETDNCHFEVMRQMNDMTNNLNKKM